MRSAIASALSQKLFEPAKTCRPATRSGEEPDADHSCHDGDGRRDPRPIRRLVSEEHWHTQ